MSDENEFQYDLKHPFEYYHGGDIHEAQFILLSAPTSRHSDECSVLRQAFGRATATIADLAGDSSRDSADGDEKETAEEKTITGSDVISMLAMSSGVNLAKVMSTGIKLFTTKSPSVVAKVDGEIALNKELIGRMMLEDLEAMLGEYLVNFTLASTLAQTRKKSSGESPT